MIDSIDLAAGAYEMTVRFENRLEDPPEDVTPESVTTVLREALDLKRYG